jgi:hypothetical protein
VREKANLAICLADVWLETDRHLSVRAAERCATQQMAILETLYTE